MITADTITDEQIRELRVAVRAERKALNTRTATYDQFLRLDHAEHQCLVALGEKRASRGFKRADARARCAEILNTRAASKAGDVCDECGFAQTILGRTVKNKHSPSCSAASKAGAK